MFAVIRTGGKQYRVVGGDQMLVEELEGDGGGDVTCADVLMVGEGDKVTVGAPLVDGASVVGEIDAQTRAEKVMIYKKRQRSTYRRKKGHRQHQTAVTITSILTDGKKAPAKKKAAKPKAEEKPVEAEAPKAEKPKAEAAAKPEAAAALDARGRLSEPQGKADDLKKIKGVGKVLEGKLNDAGIFHFWQVAALQPEQITELEEEMSFPGRIERDDWIAQAAELAKDA